MKISTKGRYGLRAMVDLAAHSGGGHVAISSIAERQNISANYLEQVFAALRKTGLVKSIKGAQGGYMLASDPSKIKVGEILRALEGHLSVIDEKTEENNCSDGSIEYCIKASVWDKMNKCLNNFADSITLEDLVEDYRRSNKNQNMIYYI